MGSTGGAELERQARRCHAEGDYRGSLADYEAAFAAYRDDGDLISAARAARTVGWFRGWVFGEWAVCHGWTAQASALLESVGDPRAVGWVRFDQARRGSDLEDQRRLFLEAIECARQVGDADLGCEATAALGLMLVFSGLVDEGMAHLDEALAAICGGGVQELPVIEGCLCGLLNACERTQDVERAQQWLDAADDVIQRGNLVAAAGYCRAHYAGLLITAGRWNDAEAELQRAVQLLAGGGTMQVMAMCRLAGLRLRQGLPEEAAALLVGLDDHEDAAVPRSRLLLVQGRPDVALEVIDQSLARVDLADYLEAPLRALAVDCLVALGLVDRARSHLDRLSELVVNQSSIALRALAAETRARFSAATGEGDTRGCWHEAISLYRSARMPVDVARARLALAQLLAAQQPPVALAEASAAYEVFDRVGATQHADEAAALLRTLDAPARTGPKRNAALTRREEEVLALLEHGLTNKEIGQRLFISPKTVEHHVGRVLAKLGLRTRSEAAAFSARNPLSTRSGMP